jgi:NADPH:quinone reductase-like Zn-dependent oxidoreductase
MKAIVIDGYGDVDQLHLRELPDPRPQADEVLVRVRAAGVNPVDWKIRQGQLRFILRPKFPFVPGGDIAGEVVSTGPEATEFKTSDPGVGFVELKRGGGYAELAVAKKTAVTSLSFVEAASLPIAGCTAVQALRDLGKLSKRHQRSHPRRSRWCRSLRRSDRQGAWSKDKRHLWTFKHRICPIARGRPRHRL